MNGVLPFALTHVLPFGDWLMVVVNGITTKEEVLASDDFALYEYDKCLRGKKYPLFVLSYVGARAAEMPKYEIILGLGQVEKEIQVEKARVIRDQNVPL
jgi:hypothetical protein